MSKYIGAYKVPQIKIKRWQDLRRRAHLLELGVDISFAGADTIQSAYDDIPDQVYKIAEEDLKKAGFDIRRGDHMNYGFDYQKEDEVMVWMEKGDDEVPDGKSGFSART